MYSHYAGTTFQFVGQLQDNGIPQSLADSTLTAAVHDPSGTILYGNLTVTVTDSINGYATFTYPSGTGTWPPGKARIDMLLTFSDGTTIASDPEYFRILTSPVV